MSSVPLTIVAIDSIVPHLTRLALEDTLRHIEPAEVLVWSHTKAAVPVGAEWIPTPVIDSLKTVADILWFEVPNHVDTDHFLVVQWDGWAIDGTAWTDDFLNYDYIGAPWWYDHHNVGNGGFSLRSRDLARFLVDRHFPVLRPEDNVLCRAYRPVLEEVGGFKWPNDTLAEKFSRERTGHLGPLGSFGFHGIFRFADVLDDATLGQRMDLFNDYVRGRADYPELIARLAQRVKVA